MAVSALPKLCSLMLKSSIKRCGSNLTRSLQVTASCFLFTRAALGIQGFESDRRRTSIQFTNMVEDFKQKMEENLLAPEKHLVFTEDLKCMIFLAEAKEKDVELVLEMAKRFNKHHGGICFGSFSFGPQVMRLFSLLNQPAAAIQALQMKELEGFFDQMISYQIAMDLLYETKHYQEALELFGHLQERRIGGIRYPRNCLTIALACCYKLNTVESLDTALHFLDSAQEYGLVVNRRLLCLAAALCVHQGRPQIALTLLATSGTNTHIGVISIKVTALSELGRADDILPILRSLTQIDLPTRPKWNPKHRIVQQAIMSAEEAINRTESKEMMVEFKRIVKSLQEHSMVSEKTIDAVITDPIEAYQSQGRPRQQEKARLEASFNPREGHYSSHRHSRPALRQGLTDME